MEKEEWLLMIEDMQKLHFLSRTMLLQKKLTLTTAELDVLLLLYLKPDILTPADVSRILGIKKESVSRLVKSLLQKELIRKTKCADDERRFFLSLTAAGNTELDENYRRILKPFYYLKRQMGDEFAAFIASVEEVNRLMTDYREDETL